MVYNTGQPKIWQITLPFGCAQGWLKLGIAKVCVKPKINAY